MSPMLWTMSVVDRHAGAGNLEAGHLGLPERRQAAGPVARPRRELDEVEGEIVAPGLAPALDQGLHFVVVLQAVADVRLALIPDRATDGQRLHGGDHAVVHPAAVFPGDRPGLDGRSAPGAVDQPDRHVQFLVQPLTEVKQRGREAAPAASGNGFGTALHPIGLHVLGRLAATCILGTSSSRIFG